MVTQSVQTNDKPNLELNISANLSIKCWDKLEVIAKCVSPDDLVMEAEGDQISIRSSSNTSLYVPHGTNVLDGHITGDLSIKSLEGESNFSQVSGNLSLRSVASTKIGMLNGNLSAKNINGDLVIKSCMGNISGRDIRGNLMIEESIAGNMTFKEIDGSARASSRGNVSLELDPFPGRKYEFQAKGNLSCRLPVDVSAKIEITRGSRVSVRIPGVEVPTKVTTPYELQLGEGDAQLVIGAAGNLSLLSSPKDWEMGEFDLDIDEDYEQLSESLNEQISAQIEAQMEMMEEELEHQLDSLSLSLEKTALSAEQAERIAEKARQASERANRRAQEKIRRSQEKMQRKLDAARRRAERKARAAERAARDRRRRPVSPAQPPTPIKTAAEPVSEEERLMILQMLEQGNISLDEAEQLLAALEGRSQ
jgi:hypothetical protein